MVSVGGQTFTDAHHARMVAEARRERIVRLAKKEMELTRVASAIYWDGNATIKAALGITAEQFAAVLAIASQIAAANQAVTECRQEQRDVEEAPWKWVPSDDELLRVAEQTK